MRQLEGRQAPHSGATATNGAPDIAGILFPLAFGFATYVIFDFAINRITDGLLLAIGASCLAYTVVVAWYQVQRLGSDFTRERIISVSIAVSSSAALSHIALALISIHFITWQSQVNLFTLLAFAPTAIAAIYNGRTLMACGPGFAGWFLAFDFLAPAAYSVLVLMNGSICVHLIWPELAWPITSQLVIVNTVFLALAMFGFSLNNLLVKWRQAAGAALLVIVAILCIHQLSVLLTAAVECPGPLNLPLIP